MKASFILSLLLLATTYSQIPNPIVLTQSVPLDGIWYVVLNYNFITEHFVNIKSICLEWDVASNNYGYQVHQNLHAYYSPNGNDTAVLTQDSFLSDTSDPSTGVLFFDKGSWGILAIDPISQSWFTMANLLMQEAIVLSRNPSVSNLITTSQVLLLRQEGYNLNQTNYATFNNSNCTTFTQVSDSDSDFTVA